MKKMRLIALILLCLLFSSCHSQDKINFLSYQAYPFDAHGILTYDGKEYEVLVSVQKAGDILLQILQPENLAGMVFEQKDGSVTVKTGDLSLPIDDGGYSAADGILLCSHMYSLSGNTFSEAGVITENGVKYSYAEYSVSCGTVTVYIQNGLSSPEKIAASLNGHEFLFVFMNES